MKKITIDDLAAMVTKGFNETKKEIQGVDSRLSAVENRLSTEIKAVDARLSTIEFLLGSNRIERLEDGMRQVKTTLKIK